MNNGGASPGLRPPVSSASPSGSNNTNTGRPPLWTPSSQRKVSRLYLYTTLPLEKIMAVVHAKSPEAPGIESANKRLNALLNKQPRWLHPRSEEDMGRRLEELALSPTRTNSSWNSINSPTHAGPATVPSLNPNPTPHLMRHNAISPSLEVPPFNQYPPPQPPMTNRSAAPRQARPANQQPDNGGAFKEFLRRTTFMSASTDHTTGSLHRLLNEYSDSYVKSVKRLVKRYTAPIHHRAESLSPISDEEPSETAWFNDPDSPLALAHGPQNLPGDFLSLDELLQYQGPCLDGTEQHMKGLCLCRPMHQISGTAWVTASGLSMNAQDLLQSSYNGIIVDQRDLFGNTILHLMAARRMTDCLFQTLLYNPAPHILNARNMAGQTFLHVLHPDWFMNEQLLHQLLSNLSQRSFDFGACDHYGRCFSHILLARDASADLRNWFLNICNATNCVKRDAFNVTPAFATQPAPSFGINRAYTQAMDLDPPVPAPQQGIREPEHIAGPAREARLLEFVRASELDPRLEDSEGRNGLHCLAAATLSNSSILQKYGLDDEGKPTNRKHRKDKPTKDLDSSTNRYELRFNLLQGLIAAGVDPNHYDSRGNTPLMAFAAQLPEDDDYKTGPKILHTLIQAGAEVNARNRASETALHVAVRCGRKLAVRQLVEDFAVVHARDAAGRSVLDVADVKMRSVGTQDAEKYAHLEACRAWLSGQKGKAVQDPTVIQEWGLVVQQ
ncbi:Ankyrin repeat domain-containing 23 [Fusarium albosuccineum]|uniref:Ankyrin repeat domain-containing 23 n=1 Tax=Fusarium albosuccineum TaxID=1237068 RepID=A0A8H4LM01_9HYPO|nr:Ankyrin repeat domain-containing 23 [Fusarium albosuccineum]